MKKIALFLSAMVLCAGIAMAQEPVKTAKNNSKTENVQVAKPDKAESQQAVQHKGCGNCPNHKQCNKGNQGTQAAAAKPDCNKSCKKDAPATKPTAKKDEAPKAKASK